jgi:hypothetical protein
MEAFMPRDVEQLSHHSFRFRPFSLGFGLGAIVMLMLAVILGGLLIDRSAFGPAQVETTGSGDSARTAREPEIDSITGAPMTHLGPGDLVPASEALKHPAPMRKGPPRQP